MIIAVRLTMGEKDHKNTVKEIILDIAAVMTFFCNSVQRIGDLERMPRNVPGKKSRVAYIPTAIGPHIDHKVFGFFLSHPAERGAKELFQPVATGK